MAPCPAPDRLDAYLDGELSPAEASAFARHAEACEACAAELALGQETLALLRSTPREACPEDVLVAALRQIEAAPPPVRARDRAPLRPVARARWGRLALIGTAVAAVLALLTLRLSATPENVPATPEVAIAEPVPPPPPDTAVAPSVRETPPAPVARPVADEPVRRAAPARPRRSARRAPALPTAAPRDPIAEAPAVDTAEARRAQEEVLLALTLIADAHRTAGRTVGQEVGEAASAFRLPLPSRTLNLDTTIPSPR